jgi:prepilin-type N-terminal cleavage/methylation domain-containing protein
MTRRSPLKQPGFTLIEIVIVLSIMGILAVLSTTAFSGLQHHLLFQKTCRELTSDLRIVRQMALTKQMTYTVTFDSLTRSHTLPSGRKVLQTGTGFGYPGGVEGPPSDPQPLRDPDGISFPNNRAVFYPRGQNSLGTLYVTDRRETAAVTLAITGRTRLWYWRNGRWE